MMSAHPRPDLQRLIVFLPPDVGGRPFSQVLSRFEINQPKASLSPAPSPLSLLLPPEPHVSCRILVL